MFIPGYLFGHHMLSILRKDVFVLGITDGVMFGATFLCVVLQKAVWKRWIDWNSWGWILQHVLIRFPRSLSPSIFIPCNLNFLNFYVYLFNSSCFYTLIPLPSALLYPRNSKSSLSTSLRPCGMGFINGRYGREFFSLEPWDGPSSANGNGPKQSS